MQLKKTPTGTSILPAVGRVQDLADKTGELRSVLSADNSETKPAGPLGYDSQPAVTVQLPVNLIEGFEIQARLGEGSMGVVYRAKNLATKQIVAIKILYAYMTSGEAHIRRFQEEANMALNLDHPNLVKVFQLGKSGPNLYIAMEFVDGMNLHELLVKEGSLSEATVAAIGMCVASALYYAWEKEKLIHRDIKPGNLLIGNSGILKVCDLGIAKRLDAKSGQLTHTGVTLGSPHYIAPEQAKGEKDIDVRVDIYALGATLYHAVTGQTVHNCESEYGLMIKHATEPVKDPRTIKPDLSDKFAVLLMKMLELDRSRRIQDWFKVYETLEEIQKVPVDDKVSLKVQSPAQ
ncbi:MAG: serine/threonine-protein kinase [Candidatus Staskawiczbacteria bacterium]|nr:serine/threonine-protein kinase [Candidatus Staskawiczbacteria bacterium]